MQVGNGRCLAYRGKEDIPLWAAIARKLASVELDICERWGKKGFGQSASAVSNWRQISSEIAVLGSTTRAELSDELE
jgi:hypothetical protein